MWRGLSARLTREHTQARDTRDSRRWRLTRYGLTARQLFAGIRRRHREPGAKFSGRLLIHRHPLRIAAVMAATFLKRRGPRANRSTLGIDRAGLHGEVDDGPGGRDTHGTLSVYTNCSGRFLRETTLQSTVFTRAIRLQMCSTIKGMRTLPRSECGLIFDVDSDVIERTTVFVATLHIGRPVARLHDTTLAVAAARLTARFKQIRALRCRQLYRIRDSGSQGGKRIHGRDRIGSLR